MFIRIYKRAQNLRSPLINTKYKIILQVTEITSSSANDYLKHLKHLSNFSTTLDITSGLLFRAYKLLVNQDTERLNVLI